MKFLDTVIVSMILLLASIYLFKTFRPKKKSGATCGCGSTVCKVPKPKLGKVESA